MPKNRAAKALDVDVGDGGEPLQEVLEELRRRVVRDRVRALAACVRQHCLESKRVKTRRNAR